MGGLIADQHQALLPSLHHRDLFEADLAGAAAAPQGLRVVLRVPGQFLVLAAEVGGQQRVVAFQHLLRGAVFHHAALAQEHRTRTQAADRSRVVRHQDDGGALGLHVADAFVTLVLKVGVAHRQGFIHDQHAGLAAGGHAERQAHLHARRIGVHRLIEVVSQFGKGFDGRQRGLEFALGQALDEGGLAGVFAAGEVGVKAQAQFENGRHDAGGVHLALAWRLHAGKQLQQGAFARSIAADQAQGLARTQFQVEVAKGPMAAVQGAAGEHLAQPGPTAGVQRKTLAQVHGPQHGCGCWCRCGCRCRC